MIYNITIILWSLKMTSYIRPDEKEILVKLTAPWSKQDVKWRVGSLNKSKDKALPLAYVDARVVMERLDRSVGAENWQDRYEFYGQRIICYLSLRINNEWICKSDGAGDSPVEAEKGGISDAFKRAAVKWGMGRELYDLKCRWMPINEYKQLVGDPWTFVINKNQIAPKESNLSKVITPEQKKEAATKRAEIINEYKQLVGDPWTFVINNNQIAPKESNLSKVITPEQKKEAATKKAEIIISEYGACNNLDELADVQTKYHNELKRFSEAYDDLFSQINTAGLEVIERFNRLPSVIQASEVMGNYNTVKDEESSATWKQ